MTTTNDSPTESEKVPETFSSYLPHTAAKLCSLRVTTVRVEYERPYWTFSGFGETPHRLSRAAVAVICDEIELHLILLLRRRYPAYFEGDGSKGFFEWDLASDTLRHEHTRVHFGI